MPLSGKSLSFFLRPACVKLDLHAQEQQSVLAELCDLLAQGNQIPDSAGLFDAVLRREQMSPTAIGKGVAVPHARTPSAPRTMLAIGIAKKGIPFGETDGDPVRIFFLLAGPPDSSRTHVALLAQIARLAKDPTLRERFITARSPEALRELLKSTF